MNKMCVFQFNQSQEKTVWGYLSVCISTQNLTHFSKRTNIVEEKKPIQKSFYGTMEELSFEEMTAEICQNTK